MLQLQVSCRAACSSIFRALVAVPIAAYGLIRSQNFNGFEKANALQSTTSSMDPVTYNTVPSALPPNVASFIEAITPLLYVLVSAGIWLGIMIPLLIVLFVASDVALRRKPIFIFNVIATVIGIMAGFFTAIMTMRSLQDPVHGFTHQGTMASFVMLLAVEFFVDGIPLFRVYSVFPLWTTRKAIWFGIFIPMLILKIARLTVIILFLVTAAKDMKNFPLQEIATLGYTLPEIKIGWVLQLVDNAACSVIFIWKLKTGHFRGSTSSRVVKGSYAARVKALFWIATSNFVFPALFNVVLVATSMSVNIQESIISLVVIHQSTIYIEIIGVIFATVWVANTRANFISSSASSDTPTSGMRFVPNPALAPNRCDSSSKMVEMAVALKRAESTPTDEIFAFQPPKKSVY